MVSNCNFLVFASSLNLHFIFISQNSKNNSLSERNITTNENGVIGSRPALVNFNNFIPLTPNERHFMLTEQSLDHFPSVYKVLSITDEGGQIRGFVIARVVIRSGVVQKRFGLAFTFGSLSVSVYFAYEILVICDGLVAYTR